MTTQPPLANCSNAFSVLYLGEENRGFYAKVRVENYECWSGGQASQSRIPQLCPIWHGL